MADQTVNAQSAGGQLPQIPQGAEALVGAMATGGVPIPSMTGGAAAPSGSEGAYSNRNPINVAPVGVNLGAILQPFNEGGPENGGFGLDLMSRYVDKSMGPRETLLTTAPQDVPYGTIIIVIGAVASLFFILKMRKRG